MIRFFLAACLLCLIYRQTGVGILAAHYTPKISGVFIPGIIWMTNTHPARFFLALVLFISFFTFTSPVADASTAGVNVGNSKELKIYARRLMAYMEMLKLMSEPADTSLAMPVHGVLTSQVTDTWHGPRDGGHRRHEGQDIFAGAGTPVYSATRGIVTKVSRVERGRGGIYAFVMGPGGRTYYYAHLSSLAKDISPGDMVATDTIVGYVGNTGNARTTPPHLHFGMYGRYGAENPFPLMVNRRLAVN